MCFMSISSDDEILSRINEKHVRIDKKPVPFLDITEKNETMEDFDLLENPELMERTILLRRIRENFHELERISRELVQNEAKLEAISKNIPNLLMQKKEGNMFKDVSW